MHNLKVGGKIEMKKICVTKCSLSIANIIIDSHAYITLLTKLNHAAATLLIENSHCIKKSFLNINLVYLMKNTSAIRRQ